jgi:hypothetical protein
VALVETDSAAGRLAHELAVKAEVNGRRLTGGGARLARGQLWHSALWRDGELIGQVDGQRAQAEEGGGGSSMRMAACCAGRCGEGVQ